MSQPTTSPSPQAAKPLPRTTPQIENKWITKEYLIAVSQDNQARDRALEKARSINRDIFKDCHTNLIYGYAKAVCKYFPDEKSKLQPQWHVRVFKTEFGSSEKFDATKLLQPTKTTSITPTITKEFELLLSVTKDEVLTSIYRRRMHFQKPYLFEQKLQKLVICLIQTHSWPVRENTKIEHVIKSFQDFSTKDPTKENQEKLYKFLSQLHKILHEQHITLNDINIKILTKTKGKLKFPRIRELFERGTKKILAENKNEDDIFIFSCTFALHAYVYKPNADNDHAKMDLQLAVSELVKHLYSYDLKNNSILLLKLVLFILHQLNDHKTTKKLSSASFSSLVWTLSLLVNNDNCIAKLQSEGCQSKELLSHASDLFAEETVWKPIADLMIFLGNREFFISILNKRLAHNEDYFNLDKNQIETFFLNLNKKLFESDSLTRPDYEGMYIYFLEMLTRFNRLHHLKSYAKDSNNRLTLEENLSALGHDFMTNNSLQLESFFGNATYLALKCDNNPFGEHVKRTIVRLFSRTGENPVNNPRAYITQLTQLLSDFNSGFTPLCEEILGKLGERASSQVTDKQGQKILLPVEVWLEKKAIPIYISLKTYILKCIPLKWETIQFDKIKNPLHRAYWKDDKLFYVDYDENRKFVLKDYLTQEALPVLSKPIVVSETITDVKNFISRYASSVSSRIAVSNLTEAYMSFQNDGSIKKEIEKFLQPIFKKMWEEEGVSFEDRIVILTKVIAVIAPFFRKLSELVEIRFFIKGKLKNAIAKNLVNETNKRTHAEIGDTLSHLDDATVVKQNGRSVEQLSKLVLPLCMEEIQEIIRHCTLLTLVEAASHFENVIGRQLDELSYSKTDFIKSFTDNPINKAQISKELLTSYMGDLSIKEQIMKDFGGYLRKKDPIPINFILPNQALSIQLCVCPELNNHNLLLKLGTGQGKSIVIALAALHEAKKIKGEGRVFVFTSYDHLAQRDHALGTHFFKQDKISSICISSLEDVYNYRTDIKIIYADFENIENIIREIILRMLQNDSKPAEIEFLKLIYGLGSDNFSIILDEYDLLLHDLEVKTPYVSTISTDFLSVEYVTQNQKYWPELVEYTKLSAEETASTDTADLSNGKNHSTVYPYDTEEEIFNLPVAVMKLSKLISRSHRIIGLSGTALESERHNVKNALFFEIPSSQNPEIFGTKVQDAPSVSPSDEVGISCKQKIEFNILRYEDHFPVIEESVIKEYCNTIINDIKQVREAQEDDSGNNQRPVLVFADPYFQYKIPDDKKIYTLWDILREKLKTERFEFNEFKEDVTEKDIRQIGLSGKVTLTTIKYGRGADIIVSLNITNGLHVIVGTPVLHKRLLYQLIGRTGRMGRRGSYSAITIGKLVMELNIDKSVQEFYSALHELSKSFVNRLINSSYNANICKRWLMFLGKAFSSRRNAKQINQAHAIALCQDKAIEQNADIKKFLG